MIGGARRWGWSCLNWNVLIRKIPVIRPRPIELRKVILIWQHITAILWKWATILEGIMADFHNLPTQMPLENLQDILAAGSKQRGKAKESKDGARQHPAAVAVAVDWICQFEWRRG